MRAWLRLTLCVGVLGVLVGCEGKSETQFIASAEALLDKRDAVGAIIQRKSALEKNPHSGKARLVMGQALLQGGDPVTAQIELFKALDAEAP